MARESRRISSTRIVEMQRAQTCCSMSEQDWQKLFSSKNGQRLPKSPLVIVVISRSFLCCAYSRNSCAPAPPFPFAVHSSLRLSVVVHRRHCLPHPLCGARPPSPSASAFFLSLVHVVPTSPPLLRVSSPTAPRDRPPLFRPPPPPPPLIFLFSFPVVCGLAAPAVGPCRTCLELEVSRPNPTRGSFQSSADSVYSLLVL